MNKVVLMGRLCNDPELRYAGEKNSPVTNFTIAVNRDYKNMKVNMMQILLNVNFGEENLKFSVNI